MKHTNVFVRELHIFREHDKKFGQIFYVTII